jgi:hypothetical protein
MKVSVESPVQVGGGHKSEWPLRLLPQPIVGKAVTSTEDTHHDILFGLIERLFEQQALRAHAIVDTTQTLDTGIDEIVSLLQQAEDETDVFGIAEPLDRFCDVIERLATIMVILDRRQLIRG